MRPSSKTQRGFTLIELISVVTVLLLLASMVIIAHQMGAADIVALKKADRINTLNQAEIDLVNYVSTFASGARAGTTNAAADADYSSTTPNTRAAMLFRMRFTEQLIDTSDLTLTTNQNHPFWN